MRLTTIAVLLAMSTLPVGFNTLAAEIEVTTNISGSESTACTLQDAIISANTDIAEGGCTAGSGADILLLQDFSFELDSSYAEDEFGSVALPLIESAITFVSRSATIKALQYDDQNTPPLLSLLAVAPGGELTANNLTISNATANGVRVNGGKLNLDDVVVSHNRGTGIQLVNNASLILRDSQVNSNGSDRGLMGGIDLGAASTARIFNSTISENQGGIGCVFLCTDTQESMNNLHLENSRITDNASYSFGGISVRNTLLYIIRSNIENNFSTSGTGGIYIDDTLASIEQSSITGNTSSRGTGGIDAGTSTRIIASTIANNSNKASGTGGITLTSNSRLFNSTISGNSGEFYGGVHASQGALIQASTIALNTLSELSGGIDFEGRAAGLSGSGTIKNSLIINNIDGADCAGHPGANSNNNLVGSGNCQNSSLVFDDTSSALQPLALNGGNLLTHALLPGSPAIDRISPENCKDPSLENTQIELKGLDQRGVKRPYDGDFDGVAFCDIGAYEYAQGTKPVVETKPESPNPTDIEKEEEEEEELVVEKPILDFLGLSDDSGGGGTLNPVWLVLMFAMFMVRRTRAH